MTGESKEGRTLYDFLVYIFEKKGLYLLSFAIVITIGGLLFVHFSAKPGTKISILKIIEYTKGEKHSSGNKSSISENDWLGSWEHTVDNADGANTGIMFFYSPICEDVKYTTFGFHENYKCKMTLLYGNIKANGKIIEGEWENHYSGQKGTFLLNLKDSKSFVGNYAMNGNKINVNKNKWIGTKIDK